MIFSFFHSIFDDFGRSRKKKAHGVTVCLKYYGVRFQRRFNVGHPASTE